MNWFGVAGGIIGVLGFAWGVRFYWELRKWAHLIKYARIVVAYKGKVKLNAPLEEWALWCKMAERDKSSNGRVVYQVGGTRVAILRKSFVPVPLWKRLITRRKPTQPGPTPPVRDGSWTAQDQTKKVKA